MDKTPVTGVDTHVVDVATVDSEKDEVTGRQSLQAHRARGAPLGLSCARNFHAGFPINVGRQSAAIETFEVGPTEMIWRADELRRCPCDDGSSISTLLMRIARNAAACCHKQQRRAHEYVAQALNLSRPSRCQALV